MVQQAQQNVQTGQAVGRMALGQQGMQQDQSVQNMRAGIEQARQQQELDLSNLSDAERRDLFDSRLQFQEDEMGRKYLNERQMADYARLTAESDERFATYRQNAMLAHQRNLEIAEVAARKVSQALQFEYEKSKQQQDQALVRELEAAQRAMREKVRKARQKAAKSAGMWGAGGVVLGGVAGAILSGGNPAGAMAGAQLGGALGAGIGGAESNMEDDLR